MDVIKDSSTRGINSDTARELFKVRRNIYARWDDGIFQSTYQNVLLKFVFGCITSNELHENLTGMFRI